MGKKLTREQKDTITEATIQEIAKRTFIEGDVSIAELTRHINSRYDRRYSEKTVHAWVYAGKWDEEKSKFENKKAMLPAKIGLENVRKEADKKDYERVGELIGIMEEHYEAKPTPQALTALIGAYKYKRDVRNSALVDEEHDDISMLLVNANKQMLSLEQKAIDVEVNNEA